MIFIHSYVHSDREATNIIYDKHNLFRHPAQVNGKDVGEIESNPIDRKRINDNRIKLRHLKYGRERRGI